MMYATNWEIVDDLFCFACILSLHLNHSKDMSCCAVCVLNKVHIVLFLIYYIATLKQIPTFSCKWALASLLAFVSYHHPSPNISFLIKLSACSTLEVLLCFGEKRKNKSVEHHSFICLNMSTVPCLCFNLWESQLCSLSLMAIQLESFLFLSR